MPRQRQPPAPVKTGRGESSNASVPTPLRSGRLRNNADGSTPKSAAELWKEGLSAGLPSGRRPRSPGLESGIVPDHDAQPVAPTGNAAGGMQQPLPVEPQSIAPSGPGDMDYETDRHERNLNSDLDGMANEERSRQDRGKGRMSDSSQSESDSSLSEMDEAALERLGKRAFPGGTSSTAPPAKKPAPAPANNAPPALGGTSPAPPPANNPASAQGGTPLAPPRANNPAPAPANNPLHDSGGLPSGNTPAPALDETSPAPPPGNNPAPALATNAPPGPTGLPLFNNQAPGLGGASPASPPASNPTAGPVGHPPVNNLAPAPGGTSPAPEQNRPQREYSPNSCLICHGTRHDNTFSRCRGCSVQYHRTCLAEWQRSSRVGSLGDLTCSHCRQARGYDHVSNDPSQPGRQSLTFTCRRVTRELRPGYTSSGDQIVCAQLYGMTGRCVAIDNNNQRKLLTAAEAGGVEVLQRALAIGVPQIFSGHLRDQRHIKPELGAYGLDWVAMAGDWDPYSRRLPNIVCGFYHHRHGQYTLMPVSRSTLATLFSLKQVDSWITECIGYPGYRLEQALEERTGVDHDQRVRYWTEHPQLPRSGRRQNLCRGSSPGQTSNSELESLRAEIAELRSMLLSHQT